MEYLINYFNTEEMIHLISTNPSIKDLEQEEIENLLNFLKGIGIKDESIHEVIYANPFYLDRSVEDIKNLIKRLNELGIEDIITIIESNPWFLNIDNFEVDEYIQEQIEEGKTMEDIIDEISMGIIQEV